MPKNVWRWAARLLRNTVLILPVNRIQAYHFLTVLYLTLVYGVQYLQLVIGRQCGGSRMF